MIPLFIDPNLVFESLSITIFTSESVSRYFSVPSVEGEQTIICSKFSIFFCDRENISKINREWISSDFKRKKLNFGWMPPHTSLFVRNNILKNNLYEESYPISGDYLFVLKLFQNNDIKIKMTLTAPGCGMGPVLTEEVNRKVSGLDDSNNVDVELVWEPQWNRDMMSEEAQLELGML